MSQLRDETTHILIIEDNIYDAYAFISILEQYQFDYHLVTNSIEAVNEVKNRWDRSRTMYRLIVTDLYMPQLDGL